MNVPSEQLSKKKKDKDEVFEHCISVADGQAFMQAKIKELENFFKNEIGLDPDRILRPTLS